MVSGERSRKRQEHLFGQNQHFSYQKPFDRFYITQSMGKRGQCFTSESVKIEAHLDAIGCRKAKRDITKHLGNVAQATCI